MDSIFFNQSIHSFLCIAFFSFIQWLSWTFFYKLQLFAYAAREHTKKYGTTLEQYAKIAYKNHKQGKNNPYASIPHEIPMKKIIGSRMVCDPITLPMSTPTADGSAAAVVCSKAFMEAHCLQVNKMKVC